MPFLLLLLGAAALVYRLVTGITDRGAGETGNGLVSWRPMSTAAGTASAAAMPVLYDFTAAWCPPCRRLDAEGWTDVAIAKRVNIEFIPVRVMDRQREDGKNTAAIDALQRKYRITSFPTLVAADGSGRELARMEGYAGNERLQEFLNEVRKKTR
ncbi:MAG: thioredoxin family protein [Acidobacteria bacterium]|nr:thioredoxin family protein [Acidobacteriota bacterium]MCA1609964.1 thioredoxin family protein [Acidobacteriota bacterium]